MRWDALNNLIDAELAGFLDGATVALAPMGRDQLRDAIQRPAARAPGVDLQPALVERLVDDTVGEPGALPLLESTLTQLWDRRAGAAITVEDYEKAGRATGFFTDRADDVLAQFTDPLEAFDVQRLLKLLAAPVSSGGGFVRSVVSMRDFPELRSVAGRLARDRLVVVGRDPHGTDTVELAHQALIDNWSRLRGWLQGDRDFRAWQQQLERDRHKWELSGIGRAVGVCRNRHVTPAVRDHHHHVIPPSVGQNVGSRCATWCSAKKGRRNCVLEAYRTLISTSHTSAGLFSNSSAKYPENHINLWFPRGHWHTKPPCFNAIFQEQTATQ